MSWLQGTPSVQLWCEPVPESPHPVQARLRSDELPRPNRAAANAGSQRAADVFLYPRLWLHNARLLTCALPSLASLSCCYPSPYKSLLLLLSLAIPIIAAAISLLPHISYNARIGSQNADTHFFSPLLRIPSPR